MIYGVSGIRSGNDFATQRNYHFCHTMRRYCLIALSVICFGYPSDDCNKTNDQSVIRGPIADFNETFVLFTARFVYLILVMFKHLYWQLVSDAVSFALPSDTNLKFTHNCLLLYTVRDPLQVFTFLESIHGTFDKYAERNIFQVECVGEWWLLYGFVVNPRMIQITQSLW
jgi:hypothetical protein